MSNKSKPFGGLPPLFTFFLNPYPEIRFTRCPQCANKTRQRKLPLAVHIDPMHLIALNKTCHYCPKCDLLIAHQDEVEERLAILFSQHAPEAEGNDYLVIGSVEQDFWEQGAKQPHTIQEMIENLHDFKKVVQFKMEPELRAGYGANEASEKKVSRQKTRSTKNKLPAPANTSMDDLPSTLALVEKMKAHVPFFAKPSKGLIYTLRGSKIRLDRNQKLKIDDVLYSGDEGGIMCAFKLPGVNGQVMVSSLTHLVLQPDQPLYDEMLAYQAQRIRKLNR